MPPAQNHRLDDRNTQKVLDHSAVAEQIPSIRKMAKKTSVKRKRCPSCSGGKTRTVARTDYNAVREHIASLSQQEKALLKKLLNVKQLEVPYVDKQAKKRTKLKF